MPTKIYLAAFYIIVKLCLPVHLCAYALLVVSHTEVFHVHTLCNGVSMALYTYGDILSYMLHSLIPGLSRVNYCGGGMDSHHLTLVLSIKCECTECTEH